MSGMRITCRECSKGFLKSLYVYMHSRLMELPSVKYCEHCNKIFSVFTQQRPKRKKQTWGKKK